MLNLSQSEIITISVNSGIFLILSIASLFLVNKLKLEQKGYKYLFWLYTIFWVPIMLVRPYRGTMQTALDANFLAIVLAAYGLVGIFIRVFADVISYLFKYRKAFLYFCIATQTILFIPLIINPSTSTNIVSSIGIGIGASCIGTYEILFKEQYGNKKAFLTVSVLSIPPLLANFLTAPIQSIIKTLSISSDPITNKNIVNPEILRYLWVIALVFLVISFVMVIFLKETRMQTPLQNYYKDIRQKNYFHSDLVMLIGLCIIGSLIAFIKFSNSDSVATSHLSNLGDLNNTSTASYEGYISVIFSLFQLVAGVLMGLYLVKKMNVTNIFLIGSGVWIIYVIISSFISNPIGYFVVHSLNGFGYGILYNLILALVLKNTIDNKIVTKMGIYQSILSVGVAVSGFFTTWMKNVIIGNANNVTLNQYMHSYLVQNMVLLGVIVAMTIAFILLMYYGNKKTSISLDRSKNTSLNKTINS